jgi:hypothetical protein
LCVKNKNKNISIVYSPFFGEEKIRQILTFLILKNPPPPPHSELDFGLVAFFGSSFIYLLF